MCRERTDWVLVFDRRGLTVCTTVSFFFLLAMQTASMVVGSAFFKTWTQPPIPRLKVTYLIYMVISWSFLASLLIVVLVCSHRFPALNPRSRRVQMQTEANEKGNRAVARRGGKVVLLLLSYERREGVLQQLPSLLHRLRRGSESRAHQQLVLLQRLLHLLCGLLHLLLW